MSTHTSTTTIDLSSATDVVLTMQRHIAWEQLDEVDLDPVLVGQSLTLRWTSDGTQHELRIDQPRDLRWKQCPAYDGVVDRDHVNDAPDG